jgi:hypothetical protein
MGASESIGVLHFVQDDGEDKGKSEMRVEVVESAERIFAGLEEALDEGLVDYGDLLGGGGVLLGDGAAAEDLLANGFEVFGVDVVSRRAYGVVHVGHALADDDLTPVVLRGRVLREGGAFDSGKVREAVL